MTYPRSMVPDVDTSIRFIGFVAAQNRDYSSLVYSLELPWAGWDRHRELYAIAEKQGAVAYKFEFDPCRVIFYFDEECNEFMMRMHI